MKPSVVSRPPPTLENEEDWGPSSETGDDQPTKRMMSSAPPPQATTEAIRTSKPSPEETQPAVDANVEAHAAPTGNVTATVENADAGRRNDIAVAPRSAASESTPKAAAAPTQTAAAAPARSLEPASVQTDKDDQHGKSARSAGKWLALLLVAAAVIGGAWLVLRPQREAPVASLEPTKAEVALPPTKQQEAEPTLAPSAVPEPATSASPNTSEPAAAPSPSAEPEAAKEPSPSSSDVIVVTVTTVPPDARFFYKGKGVGKSPFRVELKPGERRSFEIGRPGYHARKVVVDGTKKEMTVSMRPEAPGAAPNP